MESESELLAAIRQNRRGAFEQLIKQHQRLVWHLIARLIDNPDDVMELSQDTFLRVHRNLDQFRGESSLSTWIGRIAFSVASRHLRKKRVALDDLDALDLDDNLEAAAGQTLDPSGLVADWDQQSVLHRELAALSPLQRSLVNLYYLEEKSLEEIGYILEMPIGTVKNYLFRARARLRDALAPKQDHSHVA